MSDLTATDDSKLLTSRERNEILRQCTDLQRRWFEEYISNGYNAAGAIRAAGYQSTGSQRQAERGRYNRYGSERLRRLVEDHLEREAMSAAEAGARLSAQARADMGDFITVFEDGSARLDLSKAEAKGVLALVKEFKIKEETDADGHTTRHIQIKLYDAQKALDKIMTAHGVYSEQSAPNVQVNVQTNTNFFDQINDELAGG